MLITENQLDRWVNDNVIIARGLIVDLISRLVAASSPRPTERHFALSDSIDQHGPDGTLDTKIPYEPFIPEGRSYWEIGTGVKPRAKATADYRDLTKNIPKETRLESTFIFVTPLSGRTSWEFSWAEDAQIRWLEKRKKAQEWKDVRIIDGTKLICWLSHFLAIEAWLSHKMGLPSHGYEAIELHWRTLQTIGNLTPLTPNVFLTGREAACERAKKIILEEKGAKRARFETYYPEQIPDFIAAFLWSLDEEIRVELAGRCLVVENKVVWDELCRQYKNLILIAKPAVGLSGEEGAIMLERARIAGYSVFYSVLPGCIPGQDSTPFPQPTVELLTRALKEAGFGEERSHALANKSGGNLGILVNLLQKTSSTPEWALGPDAPDLAYSVFVGSWDEDNEADRISIGKMVGKGYAEWIPALRRLANSPGNPFTHHDNTWRFNLLYSGWYALGPLQYHEHLERFRTLAVTVLKEKHPKFDLSPDQRYAAQAYGKKLSHSISMRDGVADSLALLGSQSNALTRIPPGDAEITAALTVREVLSDADWVLWATLDDVLPLLAEAAPGEFIDQVEAALQRNPCPIDELFSQEHSGFFGATYISGLLWALETLAWDPDYLVRVICSLGTMASRDPGGNWGNRPINSLRTILLPWLPQTCAPISKRIVAVNTLLQEHPDVAWALLMKLIPEKHGVSNYNRKPKWMEIIPEDWSERVTNEEYWQQSITYSELAVNTAKGIDERLVDIIHRLEDLPETARDTLLTHLEASSTVGLPEERRVLIWTALVSLVNRHRMYSDTNWALEDHLVDKVEAIANLLAPRSPQLLYGRLFNGSDFDLLTRKGDYEEQKKELDACREKAILDIMEAGGLKAVIDFSSNVKLPSDVGFALGRIASDDDDNAVFPDLLDHEKDEFRKFAGGYTWGKFHRLGWGWVDSIKMSSWNLTQVGIFLSNLPFEPEAWERSHRLLGEDESPYWSRTGANPYQAKGSLERAIENLLRYGRPRAAVRCVHRMVQDKQPYDGAKIASTLLASINSPEVIHQTDDNGIAEIIKALQDDPNTNEDDLFQVEWAFLPYLEDNQSASPKLLENRLSNDPEFFCEIIRIAYKSTKVDYPDQERSEQESNVALNAHRLLHGWKTPPGMRADGSFDGNALTSWLEKVKLMSEETGHLAIAMQKVGQVLKYTPPDPDGLWIHRSVAAALNATDSGELREGYGLEWYNSRGVHGVDPTGKAEKELAAKYRSYAEVVESEGYFRLSKTLRDLAERYDREGERISSDG